MEARIDGHTQLFGLFGSPVGHSGSPVMYNYTFARLGINAAYLAFDVQIDQLTAVIQAVRTLNFGGFNVTMPCKTAIAQYLDELSPAAKLIGAVNTVVVKDGKLIGNNTDGVGFVHNLRENGVDITGKKIVLLGAGGAATAIACQTALDGAAEIAIFNRKDEFFANAEHTVEKITAADLKCKVSVTDLADDAALKAAIAQADILVNATKVGMKPLDGQSLIKKEYLRPELVVADTVYNPKETQMIKDAQEAGCKAAVGGIGMLLWQGVAAFKLFTGKDMPHEEVFEKFFA